MKTPDTSHAAPEAVGNIILKPVSHDLDQVLAAVNAAVAALEAARALPGLVSINADARGRMVKPRPGSRAFINAMAAAAGAHPGQVGGDVDPKAMADTLAYVDQLAPLKAAVDRLQTTVDDTIYGRLSGAWREALDVYASLQRQQAAHPEVAPALEKIGAYFRQASRGSKNQAEDPTEPQSGT